MVILWNSDRAISFKKWKKIYFLIKGCISGPKKRRIFEEGMAFNFGNFKAVGNKNGRKSKNNEQRVIYEKKEDFRKKVLHFVISCYIL